MAAAHAGSTIAEVASATSLACNVPAGTADRDLLIAEVTQGVTGPVPDAAVGWLLVGKADNGTTPAAMWYRFATASEPASYTFSASALGRITVSLHRYTGVDQTTPMDVAAVTGFTSSGTTYNSPSITTVTAGAIVHSVLSVQSNTATVTKPAETTLLTDPTQGLGRRQTTVNELRPTAGATGTRLWTQSSALARTYIAAAIRPSTAVGDTTAPSVPTGLTVGTPTSSTVPLTWTASTDAVGVTGYRVRRGGTLVGSPTATSYTDTGLTASTAYSYTVSAVDAAGNESAQTAAVPATTASAPPATPTLVSRMLGIPTGTTIEVATRTTAATSVRVQVSTSATFASGIISGSAVTPNAQGDSVLAVTGLSAGTAYYHRVGMTVSGVETFSAISSTSFRTDNPGVAGNFSWSFGSCDDEVDSAVFTTIAARNDDFFLHLGDWFHDTGASSYADGTGTTVTNFRDQLVKKIQATNHQALYSKTPMDYTPSDHDGMTNGSNAGSSATAWTNWNSTVREVLPLGPYPGATGVYKTWTRNRVRFIKLDRRSFASTPSATDNSSKTCLGATQKQWLKDTITAATEPAIVIVQESPWIGSAIASDDGWMGYTTERTELASFFAASGKKIIMLAGDMHALAADNGTNAPGGITVWHAAPLENATSTKGGPYSAGPYPSSGTAVASQYGRVAVTDDGSTMTLAFTGYSADNTVRVTNSVVIPPPPVSATPDVITTTTGPLAPAASSAIAPSPDVITITPALFDPALASSTAVTPTTISTTADVLAPSLAGAGSVDLPVIATTTTPLAPDVSGAVSVAPDVIATTTGPLTPSIVTADSPVPATIVVTSQVPAPAVSTTVGTVPGVISAPATIFAPTLTAGGLAPSPDTLVAPAALQAPAVTPGVATVTPSPLQLVSTLFAPTVTHGIVGGGPAFASVAIWDGTKWKPAITLDSVGSGWIPAQ